MGQKAKSKAPMIKDCLNLTVENISDGQIFGELMHQLGLELDKVWAPVKPGQRRFKRRRISADSWRYAQMYVKHQQQLKAEREASRQLAQEALCQSDHPPQNIYTDLSFQGGVITEESQVEVCDSECASLITPPSIYIQPSFLGGGDQDLSQEVKDLIEALPFAESLEDFATIVEGCSEEVIADAIALQDSQPVRQRLMLLYEAAATPPQPLYAVGQVVKVKLSSWADWLEGKISRIVEGVGTNLRVVITQKHFFQSSEVSVFSSSEVIVPYLS
jgi:hypothetical protein